MGFDPRSVRVNPSTADLRLFTVAILTPAPACWRLRASSRARPPASGRSTTKQHLPAAPPASPTNMAAASAVPPVASKSSPGRTCSSGRTVSACISNTSEPYSTSLRAMVQSGSFPFLRMGTRPAPSRQAAGAAKTKPRASIPATLSTPPPEWGSAMASTAARRPAGSPIGGVTSRESPAFAPAALPGGAASAPISRPPSDARSATYPRGYAIPAPLSGTGAGVRPFSRPIPAARFARMAARRPRTVRRRRGLLPSESPLCGLFVQRSSTLGRSSRVSVSGCWGRFGG